MENPCRFASLRIASLVSTKFVSPASEQSKAPHPLRPRGRVLRDLTQAVAESPRGWFQDVSRNPLVMTNTAIENGDIYSGFSH